ncbi:hypothetical protein GW17_00045982, partial [Ensete ventricosum]
EKKRLLAWGEGTRRHCEVVSTLVAGTSTVTDCWVETRAGDVVDAVGDDVVVAGKGKGEPGPKEGLLNCPP